MYTTTSSLPSKNSGILRSMFRISRLLGVFLILYGCASESTDPDIRILRIENGLVPGPGIVVKGHPVPRAALADRMAAFKVPGVSIAVIKNFQIEWAKAYGVADQESQSPVTTSTLFQAASISKPVAAAAALHWVEQGKLDLDQNINDQLKTWQIPENDLTAENKVTLRRILSHTAGLTVHGFPGYAKGIKLPTVRQILDGVRPPGNTPPVRVDTIPGTSWKYSGGGYTVMQHLLTDILNKPFPEILQETVLGPAGMTQSTYQQPLPENRADQASSAHHRTGKVIKGQWHTYPEMAAAGLWTTPTDLSSFAIAIMQTYQGKSTALFSRSMALEMLTEVDGGYGLGFGLNRENGSLRFSHGGSNAGFRCTLVAWADSGDGAVLMSNGDSGSLLITEILRSLSREYNWNSFTVREKEVVNVPAEKLLAYAGTYSFKPSGTIAIEVEEGRIFADSIYVIPSGRQRVELFPESELRFFATETDAVLTFHKDASGRITDLTMEEGSRKREAQKDEEK